MLSALSGWLIGVLLAKARARPVVAHPAAVVTGAALRAIVGTTEAGIEELRAIGPDGAGW